MEFDKAPTAFREGDRKESPGAPILPAPERPSRLVKLPDELPKPRVERVFDEGLWRKAKLSPAQAAFLNELVAGELPSRVAAQTSLTPAEQRDALIIGKCIIKGRKQTFPPEFESPEQFDAYRRLGAAAICVDHDPVFSAQAKTRERKAAFLPSEELFNYSDRLPEHIQVFEVRQHFVRKYKPRLQDFIERAENLSKTSPAEAERFIRAQGPALFDEAYFAARLKPVSHFIPSIIHVEALELRGEQLARINPEVPKPKRDSTPVARVITPHDLRSMPYAMWCRPAVDVMDHAHRLTRLGLPAAREFSCELSKLAIEKYAERMNDPRGVDGFRYSFFTTFEDQMLWKHPGAADAYYNNRNKILASETEDCRTGSSLCEERDRALCHKISEARRLAFEAEGRIPIFPKGKTKGKN